jgi:hypothetical protein
MNACDSRRVTSVPGFSYSTVLQQKQFGWDPAQLNGWRRDPNTLVPCNKMVAQLVTDRAPRGKTLAYQTFSAPKKNQPPLPCWGASISPRRKRSNFSSPEDAKSGTSCAKQDSRLKPASLHSAIGSCSRKLV